MLEFFSSRLQLPNAVTHALEEERLVFFCGAGISLYTGLPDFRKLTGDLFDECGVPLTKRPQRAADFCETLALQPGRPWEIAYWDQKFDRALALLEKEVPRRDVRQKLVDRLSRKPPTAHAACSLHRHLLDLAACRGGGYRLVTTNFDNRFQLAAGDSELAPIWEAPRIAAPRPESWRALTFLHGRIRDGGDRGAEDLIVTSADFGRAYLQDGWAARFIVELFREFTVLFVGYSINDPVMTYLVDAIALDRTSRRPFRQPYALAGQDEGVAMQTVATQWRSKNVEPILYSSADGHAALHATMKEWAELHRGGFESRRDLACRIMRGPCGPDGAAAPGEIETLVWALSEPNGSVARAVAEDRCLDGAEQPARIAWLRPLLAWGDRLAKLPHAADGRGAAPSGPGASPDATGAFEIDGRWLGDPLAPPAPPDEWGRHVCFSSLFGSEPRGQVHPVARHLARWVVSWLHEPELAHIVAERHGKIGAVLRDAIEDALASRTEHLPGDLGKFWRIVLRVHDDQATGKVAEWRRREQPRLARGGELDADSRARLLDLCNPRVAISTTWVTPESLVDESGDGSRTADPRDTACRLSALAEIRIKPDVDRAVEGQTLAWLRDDDRVPLLADLAPDLSECLVRVLRCAEWVEDSGPLRFHASWLPSLDAGARDDGIAPTWVSLLTLTRDGLNALLQRDGDAGTLLLRRWARYGRERWGALFVRLVVHATIEHAQATDVVLDLLRANANDLLWDNAFAGELRPLLAVLGGRVDSEIIQSLESRWLAGPSADHWSRRQVGPPGEERPYFDQLVDQRLAWLLEGGATLSEGGTERGNRQRAAWRAAAQDVTGLTAVDRTSFDWLAPIDITVLVTLPPDEAAAAIAQRDDWDAGKGLTDYARHDPVQAMTAFDLLRERQPERSSYLLEHLAAGAGAATDPKGFLKVGASLLGYLNLAEPERYGYWGYCEWLQAAARTLTVDQEGPAEFWTLWDRIWSVALTQTQESVADLEQRAMDEVTGNQESAADLDGLTAALNAPAGKLSLALLDRLWKREVKEDAGLPSDLRGRFDALVSGDAGAHRHARIMLASRLVWLYRICPEWCIQHLLWRFGDFVSRPGEAQSFWEAYLWPATGSAKLWPFLKPNLLKALRHIHCFDPDDRRHLVSQFAAVWLRPGTFDQRDEDTLKSLFGEFDADVLETITWMWTDALRVQSEAAAILWREQIAPRIRTCWTERAAVRSPELNARLGAMLLKTREAFAEALDLLTVEKPVLGPVKRLHHAIHDLKPLPDEANDVTDRFGRSDRFDYIKAFPNQVLRLLDVLVEPGVTQPWDGDLLESVLDRIASGCPACQGTDAMNDLRDYLRRG